MALADEVTSRYSSARLIQLTNANDQAATSIDTTVLGLAVTDVEAEFVHYCATSYDGSDAAHVSVAVAGVIARLSQWAEAAGEIADSQWDRFIERLQSLAEVTGRDRIKPKSTSVLTVTSERVAGSTDPIPPDTDRPDFDDLVPNPPA